MGMGVGVGRRGNGEWGGNAEKWEWGEVGVGRSRNGEKWECGEVVIGRSGNVEVGRYERSG